MSLGVGNQSFGVFARCSVTNQWSLGHPLKATTSPAAVFGSPLRHASDVRATWIPQLPRRNPICWDPASCQQIEILSNDQHNINESIFIVQIYVGVTGQIGYNRLHLCVCIATIWYVQYLQQGCWPWNWVAVISLTQVQCLPSVTILCVEINFKLQILIVGSPKFLSGRNILLLKTV